MDGIDSDSVTVQPPPLGGNPTPTTRAIPNTALGTGIGDQTVPIVLVVVLWVGSLGAFAIANVQSRRRRRL